MNSFMKLPPQQQKDEYERIKRVRKQYKPICYSATYGARPKRVSRETGMNIQKASDMLDAYWNKNWSVKELSKDQKVKVSNGKMWVYNPVSGFWQSLRFEKDIFSTLNQSTGVYCFDTWVAYFRSKGIKLVAQFHDEECHFTKDGQEKEDEEVLQWAIEKANRKLDLNVDLGIDTQFGKCYKDVH